MSSLDNNFFDELIKDTEFVIANTGSLMHSRMKVTTPLYVINAIYGGGIPLGILSEISGPPGCFTGDTRIMTLDSTRSRTIEEMYMDKGICNGTYSCTKDGYIEPTLYDSIYLSKYTTDILEIEIDNKYKVKCTPDHPFMLRDGSYKRADELEEYDSLMPMRRELRDRLSYKGSGLYEVVIHNVLNKNGFNKSEFTHILSAKKLISNYKRGVVHHEDRNKMNNHPDNLKIFSSQSEHSKYHMSNYSDQYKDFIDSGRSTRWGTEYQRNISIERMNNPLVRKWYYENVWKNPNIQDSNKERMIERNKNFEYQLRAHQGKVLSFINKLINKGYDVSTPLIYQSSVETYNKEVPYERVYSLKSVYYAFQCSAYDINDIWDDIIESAKLYNHKVTGIRRLDLKDPIPVYGIVNAGINHNYTIELCNDCGIIVSNSGKSTFSYQCMANYQNEYPEGVPVIYDMEASMDNDRLKALGVDTSKVLRLPATSLEDAFASMFKILNKIDKLRETIPNISSFQVYDSISSGGTNKQHVSAEKGESVFNSGSMMEAPRIIKQNLSNVFSYIEKFPVSINLLNQVFTQLTQYTSKLASGGGLGLKHLCHSHITFGKNEDDYKNGFLMGTISMVKLEKSKLSPKFIDIPCYIDVTKGGRIDEVDSFVRYLINGNVNIIKTGSWYNIKDTAELMIERYPELGKSNDVVELTKKNFRKDDLYSEVHTNKDLFSFLMIRLIDFIDDMYPAQREINQEYQSKLFEQCSYFHEKSDGDIIKEALN